MQNNNKKCHDKFQRLKQREIEKNRERGKHERDLRNN